MNRSDDVFVHETARVDDGALIGAGSKIWHFCHVMAGAQIGEEVSLGQNGFVANGARIGDACRIQNNVSLYAGVVLDAGVFIGPSVVFTNVSRPRARFPRRDRYEETKVGEGASIGANATILCGVVVGRGAMIGAGALVSRDVAPHALCVGVPAKQRAWVCFCGETLVDLDLQPQDAQESGCDCGRRYRYSLADGLKALP